MAVRAPDPLRESGLPAWPRGVVAGWGAVRLLVVPALTPLPFQAAQTPVLPPVPECASGAGAGQHQPAEQLRGGGGAEEEHRPGAESAPRKVAVPLVLKTAARIATIPAASRSRPRTPISAGY
jgi:hypothetical protein